MWGGEDKMEVIEVFVSSVLLFFLLTTYLVTWWICKVSYALDISVLYNKYWCCLRSDYVTHNTLSYLYPLLLTFTYIVGGGCKYYVFLLTHSAMYIRDWIIRELRSLLPALTYHQWLTRLPVVHLVTKVPRGSPDIVPRAEVLT